MDSLTQKNPEILELIREISAPCQILSFIGTGKSCGKTTAFKTFLTANQPACCGITSMGAGHTARAEQRSRVYVPRHTLFATARQTLAESDATQQILQTSGIQTPLGEIIYIKSQSAGHVTLAGPSAIHETVQVSHQLQEFGAQKVFIDGALDRKSAAMPSLADGVIFCVRLQHGAIDALAVRSRETLLQLQTKALEDESLLTFTPDPSTEAAAILVDNDGQQHPLSSFTVETIASCLMALETPLQMIFFPGAVTTASVAPLLNIDPKLHQKWSQVKLVARDATRFFLDELHISRLHTLGVSLRVLAKVALRAICVHPGDLERQQLETAIMTLKQTYRLPVLDVMGGIYAA